MVQNVCSLSRKLTGDVMKPPENHLHMIPNIQGAEAWIRLSKGHKLIPIELIGLHWHRVEREGLINSKICGKTRQNYKTYPPRSSAMTTPLATCTSWNLRWCSWSLEVRDRGFCVPGTQRGWHSRWQEQRCWSSPSSLPATWFYSHSGKSSPAGLWVTDSGQFISHMLTKPVWFESEWNHAALQACAGWSLAGHHQCFVETDCGVKDVKTLFWFQWTYKSVRMSRCLKRSLGSCCRLLFERDLKNPQEEIDHNVSLL